MTLSHSLPAGIAVVCTDSGQHMSPGGMEGAGLRVGRRAQGSACLSLFSEIPRRWRRRGSPVLRPNQLSHLQHPPSALGRLAILISPTENENRKCPDARRGGCFDNGNVGKGLRGCLWQDRHCLSTCMLPIVLPLNFFPWLFSHFWL